MAVAQRTSTSLVQGGVDILIEHARIIKLEARIANLEAENARLRERVDITVAQLDKALGEATTRVSDLERENARLKEAQPVCESSVHCLCRFSAASRVSAVEGWFKTAKRERDRYQAHSERRKEALEELMASLRPNPSAMDNPRVKDDMPAIGERTTWGVLRRARAAIDLKASHE